MYVLQEQLLLQSMMSLTGYWGFSDVRAHYEHASVLA